MLKTRFIENDERKIQERQAQQAEMQQQLQEQQLQQQAALEQAKMEQEDALNQRDNETKIIVATISSQGNDDGIQEPEYSQEAKDKLAESIRQFDARLKLDRDRLNLDKHKAEVDASLKRQALKKKTTSSK